MKIGELFVALGFDVDDAKLKDFNKNMETGKDIAGKFSLAAAGAAGALATLIGNASRQTVALQNMNLQTGQSIEGLNKFATVVQKTNPAETFESGLAAAKALNDYLTRASMGGSAAELNMLGITYKPGMTNDDVIAQLHQSLPQILKTTDKRIVSQWITSVFGDAGVIGALNISDQQYSAIGESGLLSPEKEKQLRDFADSVARLDTAWQHFEHTLGSEFAPAAKTAIDALTGLLSKVEELDKAVPGSASHASVVGGGILSLLTGGAAGSILSKVGLGRAGALVTGAGGMGGVAALAMMPTLGLDIGHFIAGQYLQSKGGTSPNYAIDFFKSMGWSEAQARGITDNIFRESKGKTGAVGDNGNAFGLMQWHPDRQADFQSFAHKDIRDSSLEEQLSFINYELTKGNEQKAGRLLRQTNTEGAANGVVEGYYARPAVTQNIVMHIHGENGQEMGDEITRRLSQITNDSAYSQRDLGANR